MAVAVVTNHYQENIVDLLDPATTSGVTIDYKGAWGSDNTALSVTQTNLISENPETRVSCTVTQPSAGILQLLFEIEATANRTVQEAGIYINGNGTLVLRWIHALLNIETGDIARYTVTVEPKDPTE